MHKKGDGEPFNADRLKACEWCFRWKLLKLYALTDPLASFDAPNLEMEDAWF